MGSWSGHGGAAAAAALVSWLCLAAAGVEATGANWGTQASHPLPPDTVVQMLKGSGFDKVKLFDAEEGTMNALKNSGLEVMVGIPNDMLAMMATSMKAAAKWVDQNVSSFLNDGVKVSKPSDGDFRPDIRDLMLTIVKFLSDTGGAFTVNIYPFISLYSDPNFPVDYAFFEDVSSPIVDGSATYTNMFDANYDTLIWALKKNGYGNLPVIVGEIGWPTDGDDHANAQLAQRFNQGFLKHIATGQGTPMRPGPVDAYLFSLIDEDAKSIQPGNFERHWGIFTFDGLPKYQLDLGSSRGLVRAKNVKYLEKKWCVLKPSVSLANTMLSDSASYACSMADCTSLGYKTSCGGLDTRSNISYAFNSFYQKNDQDDVACGFSNLVTTTGQDPSTGTCRFSIMIEVDSAFSWKMEHIRSNSFLMLLLVLLQLCLSF
ncbi:hypothetical protein ABZP36_033304 [Zizania latifolia]